MVITELEIQNKKKEEKYILTITTTTITKRYFVKVKPVFCAWSSNKSFPHVPFDFLLYKFIFLVSVLLRNKEGGKTKSRTTSNFTNFNFTSAISLNITTSFLASPWGTISGHGFSNLYRLFLTRLSNYRTTKMTTGLFIFCVNRKNCQKEEESFENKI